MNLNWFRDFSNLATTANFSRAAVMSNISQPTLSRRIRALESWAGVMLVDRSSHPVRLTVAGKQILEAAEQAIARLEAERQQILDAQSGPDKYIVNFGAQHSIGWRFYPDWLLALEEAYGPILSRLNADDLPNCLTALVDGELDYVIAYDGIESKRMNRFLPSDKSGTSLESISIGSDQLIPVCKPRTDGTPMFTVGDPAAPVPFLSFGSDAYLGSLLSPLLQQKSLQQSLNIIYENTMAGALRIRAREGVGVAWLPYSLVAPDLDLGVLCQIGDSSWQVKMDISLVRNKTTTNELTRNIWAYLARRQTVSLVTGNKNAK